MLIVKLNEKNQQQLLQLAVDFLKAGKTIVYPTDTLYGLGADALNPEAVEKIYKIKQRGFKQPIHVLLPSIANAKKILQWNITAQRLSKKFLPGPLSIALPIRSPNTALQRLTAGSGYLGFRLPKNSFALELAKKFRHPVTATSANPSHLHAAGYDPYSIEDVLKQFRFQKYRPDLIIDVGRLPKRKASTFIKIQDDVVELLRSGPISGRQIQSVL